MDNRRGLTLVEMLVVVSITGVLAALLIPAVQSAREAARRSQCLSSLRQLAIGMSNYVSRDGVFPTAAVLPDLKSPSYSYPALSRILPELEQQAIFHSINFSIPQSPLSPIASENRTASATSISTFLCPSDTGPTLEGAGAINYRLNTGSGLTPVRSLMAANEAGPFEMHDWVRPSQISDGLSFTALISERLRGDGDPSRWARPRDPWYPGVVGEFVTSRDVLLQMCGSPPSSNPPHSSSGGQNWLMNGYDYSWYNHVSPPNGQLADCANLDAGATGRGSPGSGIYAALGLHYGSVMVGTADGAARPVSSSVNLEVWRAFATRAGGEVGPSPF